MPSLVEEKCVPCAKDAPGLSEAEINGLMEEVPGWSLEIHAGVPRLVRTFTFEEYRPGLEFTRLLGLRADEANHHPLILLDYGKVTVSWWTHHNRSLNRNDFIMAAKTTDLYLSKAWERP